MAFRDYLIGEVAEEYTQGLLSRREAVRRLCLLGLALPSATALLAGCGDGDENTAGDVPAASPLASAAATPGPDAGELITFPGKGAELKGAFKAPAGKAKGAVLVVHENKGLTPHFYDLVGRFAKKGYAALAVDLVSRAGGTAKFTDPAEATKALQQASVEEQVGDLRSGIDELAERVPDAKIGTVGFCFGGGMVWDLLNAGEKRVLAAVPFYGPPGETLDLTKAKAAVLAIYAGKDDRVNAYRPAVEAALKKAGLPHKITVYDGADHAFFNDTGPRYNATAAAEAEREMFSWLEKYLT
jgi:carboxymethylenebutenolidase